MLPGNVDPRRPDKVQRYVPKTSNANGQEDLTTDYMNILGQHQTTAANAAADAAAPTDKHTESSAVVSSGEPNILLPAAPPTSIVTPHPVDDGSSSNSSGAISGGSGCVQPISNDELVAAAAAAAVSQMLPTNPQYGVAIIPAATANLMAAASDDNVPTDVTDAIKPVTEDGKELHSTPSRNDRFKVVKIASLEPFKRGRWKCMDYVDEAPPQNLQTKVAQSTGSIQVAGGVYLQTQSLPPQQIQQMLMQGGVMANGAPFFSQVPAQVMPQGQQQQYFYPQQNNMQNQGVSQPVPSSMPAQFINAGQQQYFPPGTVLQNAPSGFSIPAQSYQNIQYVPANLIPNQNSAFVPTSQTVQLPGNFQQSQSYAGQPQSNVQQPLVNGHAFEPNQITPSSLPNQTAKSIILNNQQQHQQQPQTQNMQAQSATLITQNQSINYQQPNPSQGQSQPPQQQSNFPQNNNAPSIVQVAQIPPQNFDQNSANAYANPQFAVNVNSLTGLENNEAVENPVADSANSTEQSSETADDKTNPVVNAIDNKIEQAMDLVKSHLMYTVREEVEVLKEKIIELTEKIQQLETENSFLRSQLPKNQTIATSAAPTANTNSATQSQTNTSPNVTGNNASTGENQMQQGSLPQQQQPPSQVPQPTGHQQQQQQPIPSQQQNVTVTQQQQQQAAPSQQPPQQ